MLKRRSYRREGDTGVLQPALENGVHKLNRLLCVLLLFVACGPMLPVAFCMQFCTMLETPHAAIQPLFECLTCCPVRDESKLLCLSCALTCHAGTYAV